MNKSESKQNQKFTGFFLCYYETTRQCNLQCPYCMARVDPAKIAGKKELSTDEIKHLVIDEIYKYTPNGAIAFSGGETLMRPDAMEIIKYNAKKGLWTFINTNGKLLTEETLKKLKKITDNHIMFVLPFNSTENDVHEWSRNDDLKTVVNAGTNCEKLGMEYFYLLTISRSNLDTLSPTMKYLKLKQLPMLRAPFVPRGAGNGHRELMFTREDMAKIIHPILRENYLSYISYTPFFASPEAIERKWQELGITIGQLGCQAGKGFIGISAEGMVTPCVQMLDNDAVSCGNVRDLSLSKIITGNQLLNDLRDRKKLEGKCGRCRYKHTCGGCRALAFYKTGNIFAEDDTCHFDPIDETTRSEYEEESTRNFEKFLEFLKYNEPWNMIFG
ncbi:MAG: radical SAM protein [Elusimicrobiota bacterium]